MEVAHAVARRSLCARAQVGAVVTDTTNRVVATGFNGPPSGYRHGAQPCNLWCKRAEGPTLAPDYTDCVTLHAESNALLYSDRSLRQGGTIYITSHVCWGCAKLIANSGLHRVVVHAERPDLHRDPMASYTFLMECGLDVEVNDAVMMARLKPSPLVAAGWIAGGVMWSSREARRSGDPQPRTGSTTWLSDEGVCEIYDGTSWIPFTPPPRSYHPERLAD